MADNKAIITSTTPAGATVQKTITGISPYATNEQLATFGQMLNGLSNNTYGKTEKVTKVNCDAEEGGGKPVPTFTIRDSNNNDIEDGGTYNYTARSEIDFNFTYNGESEVFTTFSPPTGASHLIHGNATLFTYILPAGTYNIIFYVQETENYQAAQISFTVVFS